MILEETDHIIHWSVNHTTAHETVRYQRYIVIAFCDFLVASYIAYALSGES